MCNLVYTCVSSCIYVQSPGVTCQGKTDIFKLWDCCGLNTSLQKLLSFLQRWRRVNICLEAIDCGRHHPLTHFAFLFLVRASVFLLASCYVKPRMCLVKQVMRGHLAFTAFPDTPHFIFSPMLEELM